MKPVKLILASGSPRRRELLAQIGLDALVIPSKVEEHAPDVTPDKVVEALSLQKAEKVAERVRRELVRDGKDADCDLAVIGADTVVSCDGKILGKPKSHAEAAEMICMLAGRTHEVYTGVTVIRVGMPGASEECVTFSEKTAVSVFPMTEEEIRRYAMSEEPMDKAGAYGIQGSFAAFISGISGDYTNVVGLPVGRLYQTLKETGCV